MSALVVENLSVHFPIVRGVLQKRVGTIRAVNEISFTLGKSETIGIVGESGCGKSTLAKTLMGLIKPTSGSFNFFGNAIQMIFQDPNESINPTFTVGDAVEEPFLIHGSMKRRDREEKVKELLHHVGLDESAIPRYIHEFSGGQRQRICIARAIALNPKILILDEPVSALDVSIQAQILNLLLDIQEKFSLSYLFISHNLHVVHHMADRIFVMNSGKCVEFKTNEEIFKNPSHTYTKELLAAIPKAVIA